MVACGDTMRGLELAIASVLCVTIVAEPASGENLPPETAALPLSVADPFVSASASARLSDQLSSDLGRPLTKAEISDLSQISLLAYTFTPPFVAGEPDRPASEITTISREIDAKIGSDLSPSAITDGMRRALQESCEQHSEISSIATKISDSHHLSLSGHVAHSEWWCGNFLGWPYKTLKGKGDADFRMSFTLGSDLSPKADGDPEIYNQHVDNEFWVDLLGLLGVQLIPVVLIVKKAITDAVNGAVARAASAVGNVSDNARFSAMNSGLKSLSTYTSALDQSGQIFSNPTLSYDDSGFVPGSEAAPIFRYVQTDQIAGRNARSEFRKRAGEIAYIKGLSHDQPDRYVVARGESLWKILARRYPDPRIFIMVEDINHLRRRKLVSGEAILIPQLWQVFARVGPTPTMVAPGDSIWSLRKRRGGNLEVRASDFRSGRLGKIYPYESLGTAYAPSLLSRTEAIESREQAHHPG